MNLNLKNRFVVVVFVLIIFIPLSTADDTNNFKSDNLVNNFKSVTEVTNITNVNINQSVNVSSCNPANQALGNWNGTGWECVSIADDDSGYLTFESDPVAMANISLNFNTWMLWSLDKPNYLLKSELNNTFDRNHANETNLEWSKSGHIIDTNLDMNFYPIYNISEIKPYTSGEFGLYELFDPTFISFIDHQLALDTNVFQIEPTLVSSFKDLDMNGHNILNSPSLNDNDSQYLNKSDYYNASNDLQTSKDYTNSSNISMKNYVDSKPTALSQLTDVSLLNPVTNQFLMFNGMAWMNTNMSMVSAGPGVEFFYNNTASDIGGYETISKNPDINSEQDESTILNNNTVLFEKYISQSSGLGGSQIDAGQWTFEIYTYVNSTIGLTELLINVSKATSDGGNNTFLFSVSSGNIINTNPTLYSINTVQQAVLINSSDRLIVNISGKTNIALPIAVHFIHSGTVHYSNIHTPLVIRHNDLAGLQGGTSGEYYHLTNSQLTQVINQLNINSGMNTTDTALAANDTQDRAYVNTTFIKIANATTCTGTDKSVWNGTSFICSTDQTGSGTGTSFTQYNRTTTDTKFGSLTSYNKTMTISLTANKVISGECLLLVNSSVTTALPNLYFNITGNASGTTNLYYDTDVFTSATASTSAFSTVQNTTLNPTAVLTTPLPYTINWWVNEGASGGNFTIAIKSSVTAGSIVTLNRGSYCRSIEI